MNPAVLHYYRQYRAHGYTALAAWNSARSFVHFRERLSEYVRKGKRKSRGK